MRSEDILRWVKGPAVLDVGCTGHITEPGSPYWLHGRLREQFPEVVGIDINEENIDKLKKLGYAELYPMSAEDFECDRKFDSVVAGELIEHISNPGAFLVQCRKHLKPDGRLVITTPYAFSLLYIMYAFLKFPKTCQNPEHTCWFCPQTLREHAGRVGFEVSRWELIEDYRPDDPSWRYRLFVKSVRFLKFLIPRRLRCNTMLFVLEIE
jgi:SAM-dependent methyltransferase